MLHVTPVAPQIGQALRPAGELAGRICGLRAIGQSDAAIARTLVGLTQDELSAAFAAANRMCPASAALVPTTPPVIPEVITPPQLPPAVPTVCPPCPPHEEHWPWWVWALIGFGAASGVGLIVYAATRKKK